MGHLDVRAMSYEEMLAAQERAFADGAFAVQLLDALADAQEDGSRFTEEQTSMLARRWDAVSLQAFRYDSLS